MRPFNRLQRGSTNWPFVIVLLALFVFIYMWWDAQDGQDQKILKIKKLEETNSQLVTIANADRERETAVAQLVGFPLVVPENGPLQVQPGVTVNVDLLKNHLEPEGIVVSGDQQIDGTVNHLLKTSSLRYKGERRLGEVTKEAKEYVWKQATPELRAKIQEVAGKEHPVRPMKPGDPDDAAANQRYEAELAEYKQQAEELRGMIRAIVDDPGWEEIRESVTDYGIPGADEETQVEVLFLTKPSAVTVEEAFNAIRDIPAEMGKEISAVVEGYVKEVARLNGEISGLKDQLNTTEGELTAQRETYTTDIGAKEAKIQATQEELSAAQLASQTAANQLAKERDDFRGEKAKLVAESQALQEAVRLMKQKRDLIIRRDDPDGEIVLANPILRTGTIDIGTADKVYVGQRFNVSALDRVGDRMLKGEVMVTKVTGRKSARIRIIKSTDTIVSGDFIHNPLYQPTDTIHVYFAAPMAKWPSDMASGRLKAMGVILQNNIDGDTDYIVVPDTWTVPADTGGDEDDEGDEEEMVGGKSPLEKMEGRARIVGATVITERLFDAFLDY